MSGPNITIDTLPHVVIRASAGSGKTYQLSNRYLDLLHHDFKSETILATTFTRKAAGEILERILRRLAMAATDAKQAKELSAGLQYEKKSEITLNRAQALLKDLCRSLHRVSVSTIDSFFNRIASSFRHELRLPLNPQLVDAGNPLAVQVRAMAIDAMLGDTDLNTLIDLLKRLHHDSAQRKVTEALDEIVTGLYEIFRATRREDWHQLHVGQPLDRDVVIGLIQQIELLAGSATDKRFAKAIHSAREAALSGNWDDFLCGGLPCALVTSPTAPTYFKKPLDPAQIAAFTPLVAHAKAVLLTQLAQQTSATYDLLARFDAHYTQLRDQHRVLLFSDLPHKLARELPERGDDLLLEICYRLDSAVGHLLLDEFQDTSFEQWKVLGPFASEIASFSDGSRTFFCVGDIKQAIYGWRGGRAELFDRIVSELQLPPDSQVSLDVSFRSSQLVLDAVNKVFTSLPTSAAWKDDLAREEATQWAGGFAEHKASRTLPGYVEFITSPATDAPAVEAHERSDGDGDEEVPPPEEHEDFVAQTIARLSRDATGRSIGVLVSQNVTVDALIFRLRALGVDASAEGAGALVGDPAVDVVLSALTLADHPGHSAAAFHVLNSPLGPILGLTAWRGAPCDRLAHFIRNDVFSRGFAAVIADWARSLAPSCDSRSAQKLTQLVELADRFEPGITPRMSDFIETARSVRIEEPSQSQVRVMTIHKSKGLEFDIVVLPELGKKMGRVSSGVGVIVDRDRDSDGVLAVYRATNKHVRALSPQLQSAYDQERLRRLRDDLCALYVAMTRARHALHLIAEPLKLNKSGALSTKGFSDQSFASVLRHALCDDAGTEDLAGDQTLYYAGNSRWFERSQPAREASPQADLIRFTSPSLAPTSDPSRRSWRQVAPSSLHGRGRVRVADLLDVSADAAMQRGTLMHGWFELIEWLGSPQSLPSDEMLLAKARSLLPAVRHDDAWLTRQIAEFRRMLAKPQITAALTKRVMPPGETDELWRERPFAVRLGDALLRGSFDRVIITRQGGRAVSAQVLDFKTDGLDGSAAQLADRIAFYRPQLEAYGAALSSMLRIDVKRITASLLFVSTGEVCGIA